MDKKLSHSDIWDTHIKNIPLNLNPHCAKFTRPPPPPLTHPFQFGYMEQTNYWHRHTRRLPLPLKLLPTQQH